jgi:hypothetical protein
MGTFGFIYSGAEEGLQLTLQTANTASYSVKLSGYRGQIGTGN